MKKGMKQETPRCKHCVHYDAAHTEDQEDGKGNPIKVALCKAITFANSPGLGRRPFYTFDTNAHAARDCVSEGKFTPIPGADGLLAEAHKRAAEAEVENGLAGDLTDAMARKWRNTSEEDQDADALIDWAMVSPLGKQLIAEHAWTGEQFADVYEDEINVC